MMQLMLRVVGWPEGVPQVPLMAYFDEDGGMVGRSETARLCLPDPMRTVSRFHAHISCRDGVYSLEDMGSTNPASINGTMLSPNQRCELAIGDQVQVGGYTLLVECDDPAKMARHIPAPPVNRKASAWGNTEDTVHTRFVPMDEEPALTGQPTTPPITSAPPSAPLTQPSAIYRSTTVPQAASSILHELARELPPSAHPAPAVAAKSPPSALPRQSVPTLSLSETGAVAPATPASVSASTEELWRAFQEGAQISMDMPGGVKLDLMRSIGAMLRRAISGMRRLAGQSTRSRSGNTLRLAADDARALAAALRPPVPGFLTGPMAVDELMSALEAQHAATQMAVRVVVDQALQRFEPTALESRLAGSGLLGLLPMLRKARLWDLYGAQHRALAAEVREGLREAFERALITATELDQARLEQERKKRS